MKPKRDFPLFERSNASQIEFTKVLSYGISIAFASANPLANLNATNCIVCIK